MSRENGNGNGQDWNLKSLLTPFRGTDPAGEFLRYTEVYDQIREARREDDASLPQGIWQTEIKKADWDQLVKLTYNALLNRSKDLQIAVWLTEGWMYTEGVAGLSRGLELIYGLTKGFWDCAYPKLDASGYEHRIVPYDWINDRLSDDVPYILITMPSESPMVPYRLIDWNEANRIEIQSRSSPERAKILAEAQEKKRPTVAKLKDGINKTPVLFYAHILEECDRSLKLLNLLDEELKLHLDGESPSFYKIREKIENFQRFARGVVSERGTAKVANIKTSKSAAPVVESMGTYTIKTPNELGPIQSREQAYARLKDIADYLAKVEPHSPTPYLIRKAVTWANKPLGDIFKEVVETQNDVNSFIKLISNAENK
ncbi:Type VI secretion system protein TssA [Candidatus Bealeia paramacronuclearis]|uniref:Type VI secretion system protein TssA n=1 Tax=Candidatus Bealeia paramacronuclearis TaxID=1921001 RepID=A0ABZ2C4Y4_9PROT|nr:Type VI secretion system protein TssA [Candidatus Bealeia paramacronuclearis]